MLNSDVTSAENETVQIFWLNPFATNQISQLAALSRIARKGNRRKAALVLDRISGIAELQSKGKRNKTEYLRFKSGIFFLL